MAPTVQCTGSSLRQDECTKRPGRVDAHLTQRNFDGAVLQCRANSRKGKAMFRIEIVQDASTGNWKWVMYETATDSIPCAESAPIFATADDAEDELRSTLGRQR